MLLTGSSPNYLAWNTRSFVIPLLQPLPYPIWHLTESPTCAGAYWHTPPDSIRPDWTASRSMFTWDVYTIRCLSCSFLEPSTLSCVHLVNVYMSCQGQFKWLPPQWSFHEFLNWGNRFLIIALPVSSSVIVPVTTEWHLFVGMNISPPLISYHHDHLYVVIISSYQASDMLLINV